MRNLFARASAWLARQDREHASDMMQYSRPGVGTVVIPIKRQRANAQIQDAEGLMLSAGDLDFTLSAKDLDGLTGQPTVPMRGDRITTVDPSTPRYWFPSGPVYEVLDVPNEGPFRFCDGFRNQVRVHTKFIGIAGNLKS
jgi:hypothetical protein